MDKYEAIINAVINGQLGQARHCVKIFGLKKFIQAVIYDEYLTNTEKLEILEKVSAV